VKSFQQLKTKRQRCFHYFQEVMIIISVFVGMIGSSIAQDCYWSSHAGGILEEGAGIIGTDNSGNVFAVGTTNSYKCYFNGDTLINGANNLAFLIKYDMEGNLVWIKEFDGAGTSQGEYVGVVGKIDTISNFIIACGSFYGHLSIPDTNLYGQGTTLFLMKLD
jgi:hypothetical protein